MYGQQPLFMVYFIHVKSENYYNFKSFSKSFRQELNTAGVFKRVYKTDGLQNYEDRKPGVTHKLVEKVLYTLTRKHIFQYAYFTKTFFILAASRVRVALFLFRDYKNS